MAGGGRIARRDDSRRKWRWRRCFSAFSVETEQEREKGAGLRSGEGVRASALCPSGGRGGQARLGGEGGNGAARGDETSSSEDASCAGGEATEAAIWEGIHAELLRVEERNDT